MGAAGALFLGDREIDAAFPFHVAFGRDGRVTHVGAVLRRLDPGLVTGSPFTSHFRIVRPSVDPTFECIARHASELFLLQSLVHDGLMLRGQMLPISGGETLVFLGQPRVSEIASLNALGLSVGDFAVHDAVVDFCFALQAQTTALAEASSLADELASLNQDLELRVQARTNELGEANASMLRVLENVGQGFVCVEPDGTMATQRSAILERWLGPAKEGVALWDYLASEDSDAAAWLAFAWGEVFEDVLPLELTLSQLPAHVVARGRVLDLDYRPIFQQDRVARILVIASDGTDRVARERSEARQQEALRIFECLMTDKEGFVESFAEVQHLVEAVLEGAGDLVTVKRNIHTIKGTSGFLGVTSLSTWCHAVETRIAEDADERPREAELAGLRSLWNNLRGNVERLLGTGKTNDIRIDDAEFEAILRAVLESRSPGDIAAMIRAWKLEPSRLALGRLGAKACALARSLGKEDLEIGITAHELRLDPGRWRAFWSALVHVIRNAVDHGIEAPDERAQVGKRPNGRLDLSTSLEGDRLVVEIADDGRGMDWARIAAKAARAGLPHQTAEDLCAAVFSDGLSTRDVATEISGRGVGLAVARAACLDLGGHIQIASTPGEGTRFRFIFPTTELVYVPPRLSARPGQLRAGPGPTPLGAPVARGARAATR